MSSTHLQVVVGFDFSHSGRAALDRAISLATRAPCHVLHFVCVIEPHTALPALPTNDPIDYLYAEQVQRGLTTEIELELQMAKVSDQVQFYVHARIGKPAEEILAVASDVGADSIIVGSKGLTGLERLVLGSVSEKVVRGAGCTVEVAREKTYAHVDLLAMVEVAQHLTYSPPHRYTYENHSLNLRPLGCSIEP